MSTQKRPMTYECGKGTHMYAKKIYPRAEEIGLRRSLMSIMSHQSSHERIMPRVTNVEHRVTQRAEEIGLQIFTTAKISNKFSRESPQLSTRFSRESPIFQTSFHGWPKSPSLKRMDRETVWSRNLNVLSLISSMSGKEESFWAYLHVAYYGVATISRLPKNIGPFCKRALQNRRISTKETYILKEPANRSQMITMLVLPLTLLIQRRHTCTHKILVCIQKRFMIYMCQTQQIFMRYMCKRYMCKRDSYVRRRDIQKKGGFGRTCV